MARPQKAHLPTRTLFPHPTLPLTLTFCLALCIRGLWGLCLIESHRRYPSVTAIPVVAGARLPAEAEWCLYVVDGFCPSPLLLLILLLRMWVHDPCLFTASQGATEVGCWALALHSSFPAGPGSRGPVGKRVNPWSG